ncbi:uncharacterized protein [Mytilus edulis]|uniref:Uncharacterized protein n=3 Tax=Mytilus TaxID=6548 RepID=A0A8B6G0V3_MYTGA|nr:unnamed protein product [Mytilus edulis]VDI57138.1 Hypothetical predicted protein [Mytilus galloprovincialis]
MAFWIVHFLVLLLVLNAEGQIDCKYETAIANCFCSTEINILQNVRIIEIQSESCNCTINFLKAQEQPPTVVHVFNKLCNWLCNEIECVPDNILPEEEKTTRKQEITTVHVPDNVLQNSQLEMTNKQKKSTTLTTNQIQDKTIMKYGDKMSSTMETAMIAFWAGCGIFGMFTFLSVLKWILQLKRNTTYLPLHQPLDNTTITADRHQISQTQTSFLSMISSTVPPSLTPPPTSTPDYSIDRLPVFSFESTPIEHTIPLPTSDSPTTFFENRDSSPEPSAPPMEMVELNEPVAIRTRNKKKQLEAAL